MVEKPCFVGTEVKALHASSAMFSFSHRSASFKLPSPPISRPSIVCCLPVSWRYATSMDTDTVSFRLTPIGVSS